MKIDKIKTALLARAQSLNINTLTLVPDKPVVPVNPIVPKSDKPVGRSNPSDKNSDKAKPNVKDSVSPQISLIPAQVDETKKPDKVAQPIVTLPTVQPELSADKPTRKAASHKQKENAPAKNATPLDDIDSIVAKYLKAGRDFDRLPNTTKPTLLKSGAEILAAVFGFRTSAKVINRVEIYDKQFVMYEVCVTVFDQDDKIVAVGLGSCNSRERKYLKSDFASNLNTVLKIAKKRAFVDAILSATHASCVFTQDIEDIVNLQISADIHGVTIK